MADLLRRAAVFVLDRLIAGLDGAEEGLLGVEQLRGRAQVLRKAAGLCDELADGLEDAARRRMVSDVMGTGPLGGPARRRWCQACRGDEHEHCPKAYGLTSNCDCPADHSGGPRG